MVSLEKRFLSGHQMTNLSALELTSMMTMVVSFGSVKAWPFG